MYFGQKMECECRYCKKLFEGPYMPKVNADRFPEEKEKFLSLDLFRLECPYCHEINNVLYDVYYVADARYEAFYLSIEDMDGNYDVESVKDKVDLFKVISQRPILPLAARGNVFNISKDKIHESHFICRVFHDPYGMIESILCLEAGFDDRLIKIIKRILIENVNTNSDVPYVFDSAYIKPNVEKKIFELRLYVQGEYKALQEVDIGIYEKLAPYFLSKLDGNAWDEKYFYTDEKWAEKFLETLRVDND